MSNYLVNRDFTCHSSEEQDKSPNNAINSVFAKRREEEEVYPLTIADAQRAGKILHKIAKHVGNFTLARFQIC